MTVFAFGSAEKGQLGNGTTGERLAQGSKVAFDIESVPGELANLPPARLPLLIIIR
jgi:hypothetical protein